MDVIRLLTVHPALVHFTIGTLPVIVLAYAVARWRSSAAWTFAADVTLFVTAALTLLTSAFGLIAFLMVDWPGGLGLWRWLHFGLGVASTVLLVGFALWRAYARRRSQRTGGGTALASAGVALVVLAAGWVGGEALVFHGGIAVKAAGNGALAPPTVQDSGTPENLHDAMHHLRAHWAAIELAVAGMVVERPSDEAFDDIARHARVLESTATWLSSYDEHAPEHAHEHEPVAQLGGAAATSMSFNEKIASMSPMLESRAGALREAAHARDLPAVATEAGELTKLCASCHDQLRWGE